MNADKIQALHDSVFTKETRKERYALGQFCTEAAHVSKFIALVLDMFDKNKKLTLYDPCVGTGILEVELLSQLTSKYGVGIARKIATRRLKLADIDPKMIDVCKRVLFLHTEELFGEGINFDISVNDLMTDSFDLSKMIVYGNLPFNRGTDFNYLAKIFKQQMNCGLSSGIFMCDSATFDSRKAQSKNILGEDFYTWIKEEYSTNDFEKVAVKISVISFDKSRKFTETIKDPRFTSLGNLLKVKSLTSKQVVGHIKFEDETSLVNVAYLPEHSVPYLQQRNFKSKRIDRRMPSPTAPQGSKEKEIYDKWMKERKIYPVISTQTGLCVARYSTVAQHVHLYYVQNLTAGFDNFCILTGDTKYIGAIGLIIQSIIFKIKLHLHFPKWQRNQHNISAICLRTLPIPKDIPDRLYEIGQTLIIENKEDKELRKEADEIIEELYTGLDVISFDKSREWDVTLQSTENNFTSLKDLNIKISMIPKFSKGVRYNNGAQTIQSKEYEQKYSCPFITQKTLKTLHKRIPLPDAPMGSLAREALDRYKKDKGAYPKIIVQTFLAVGSFTTSEKLVTLKYFENIGAASSGAGVFTLIGDKRILSIIGLIYTSRVFCDSLYDHFPQFQRTQRALYLNNQKTFPIPKNIPDRLYEIGQVLIIEGKEDAELRKEADEIIEELYRDLNI